jgi:hypothetical protein
MDDPVDPRPILPKPAQDLLAQLGSDESISLVLAAGCGAQALSALHQFPLRWVYDQADRGHGPTRPPRLRRRRRLPSGRLSTHFM